MKLKTLKDFVKYYDKAFRTHREAIPIETLRQEVIKWIKELDKLSEDDGWEHTLGGFQITNVPYECCESATIRTWIKYFFNITDEELK